MLCFWCKNYSVTNSVLWDLVPHFTYWFTELQLLRSVAAFPGVHTCPGQPGRGVEGRAGWSAWQMLSAPTL